MFGTTTTVNPNVFGSGLTGSEPSRSKAIDLESQQNQTNLVDLEEAKAPEGVMDLDGKLEEENFGQAVNENVSVEDVATPLSKGITEKKNTKK